MRANKHLLLWSSLGTLLLLGWAAFDENVRQDWRVLQREYRERLPAADRQMFHVQLRQVVVPALGIADRCVSCHVGMAPGEAGIEGDPVFARHPDVVHDPTSYGCTTCHGGQGRATTTDAAHGSVEYWPEPMIPLRFAYAGCGSCHTHLRVPNLGQLQRGAALFERNDCLACHAVDGRGGTLRPGGEANTLGPDLSRVGAGATIANWYAPHLEHHQRAEHGPWRDSFREIDAADREMLEVYLRSRVGAPGLVESKALFHSLGCRGCHRIGGMGGDDGPDLTLEGQRDPGRLDFSAVPAASDKGRGDRNGDGARSFSAWLAEHFRAPAVVVPGSAMPTLGLDEQQIQGLVFYMHSLRRANLPEAFWPRDRIEVERFGEREFRGDGATLYGTFCSACHGPKRQGMRYPGMAAFPSLAAPELLELASGDFLRATIEHGRPGRRMPAWGELEGGLGRADVDAIIAYLRREVGGIEPLAEPRRERWVDAEAAPAGEALYAANCASCHGAEGAGNEGPALRNRILLGHASDTFFAETIRRGRSGTSMPAFGQPSLLHRALEEDEIEAIVAYIRTWEGDR